MDIFFTYYIKKMISNELKQNSSDKYRQLINDLSNWLDLFMTSKCGCTKMMKNKIEAN